MLPLLKYVKGEVLSSEHWHEMFHMLGFPKGTTLEKLSFGDILSHADDIVSNADKLKELYRYRTMGERSGVCVSECWDSLYCSCNEVT